MLIKCAEQAPGDLKDYLDLLISVELFESERRCDQSALTADGELSRCAWTVTCYCSVIASARDERC